MVRSRNCIAERLLRSLEVVTRKLLVHNHHLGRRGRVASRKVTPGNQRNAQRLVVVVAYPRKLDVKTVFRLFRVA